MTLSKPLSSLTRTARLHGRHEIVSMPTGNHDFLPEIGTRRASMQMTTLFGETMSKKNANKTDKQQTFGD